MSEGIEVYKAIVAVAGELAKEGIAKDKTCTQGASYKFRGIDDVYNALAPYLAKHNLCVLPRMLERESVERISKNGGALFYTTVTAEFDFVSAVDGSKHTVGPMYGEAMDSGDKGTNKAMSAAYKYAAFQAFCIPTEGDNDTENQTHEVKPQKSQQGNKPSQQQRPQGKTAVEVSKAQKELYDSLAKTYHGNLDEMSDALRTYSSFTPNASESNPTPTERWLKLSDLEHGNDNEKFQRWVGASLKKFREDTASVNQQFEAHKQSRLNELKKDMQHHNE